MGKLRLAIIGCGMNAQDHAPAFRAAGFDITAVCGTPGSRQVHPFAERHGIPLVFDKVTDLLDARREWDGLLIVVSVDAALGVLELALEADAPILIEKPISYRSKDLLPFLHRDLPIIVGYNRRYFRPVREARKEVTEGPLFLGSMIFPQSINTPSRHFDDPRYLAHFFSSVTILGLDLARFIFGELHVEHVCQLTNPGRALLGIAAILRAESGSLVQFMANFQASSNFSVTLDRPGRRFELKPFEAATIYEGLEMRGPNSEWPMRTYTPKISRTIALDDVDYHFKPGYVTQAETFARFIRGECPGIAARLYDAYAALQLAEQLAGQTFPE